MIVFSRKAVCVPRSWIVRLWYRLIGRGYDVMEWGDVIGSDGWKYYGGYTRKDA